MVQTPDDYEEVEDAEPHQRREHPVPWLDRLAAPEPHPVCLQPGVTVLCPRAAADARNLDEQRKRPGLPPAGIAPYNEKDERDHEVGGNDGEPA
jgi:hypothetical protein